MSWYRREAKEREKRERPSADRDDKKWANEYVIKQQKKGCRM